MFATCEILVLGKQPDGAWTLIEAAGTLLGHFASYKAAQDHAFGERRSRPDLLIATSAGAQRMQKTHIAH